MNLPCKGDNQWYQMLIKCKCAMILTSYITRIKRRFLPYPGNQYLVLSFAESLQTVLFQIFLSICVWQLLKQDRMHPGQQQQQQHPHVRTICTRSNRALICRRLRDFVDLSSLDESTIAVSDESSGFLTSRFMSFNLNFSLATCSPCMQGVSVIKSSTH